MSFSLDYIVLPTMMHEIAHTVGVGCYNFGSMSVNQIWQGEHANALFATIPDPPQPELRADAMHFWPYGLNQASEYESEADLIYHVQLVAAIREDLTIWQRLAIAPRRTVLSELRGCVERFRSLLVDDLEPRHTNT